MALDDIRGKPTRARRAQPTPPPSIPEAPGASRPDAPREGWTRWTVHARTVLVEKMRELSRRSDPKKTVAQLTDEALAAFLERVEARYGPIEVPERRPKIPLDLDDRGGGG